jgi:hypothetical protein
MRLCMQVVGGRTWSFLPSGAAARACVRMERLRGWAMERWCVACDLSLVPCRRESLSPSSCATPGHLHVMYPTVDEAQTESRAPPSNGSQGSSSPHTSAAAARPTHIDTSVFRAPSLQRVVHISPSWHCFFIYLFAGTKQEVPTMYRAYIPPTVYASTHLVMNRILVLPSLLLLGSLSAQRRPREMCHFGLCWTLWHLASCASVGRGN